MALWDLMVIFHFFALSFSLGGFPASGFCFSVCLLRFLFSFMTEAALSGGRRVMEGFEILLSALTLLVSTTIVVLCCYGKKGKGKGPPLDPIAGNPAGGEAKNLEATQEWSASKKDSGVENAPVEANLGPGNPDMECETGGQVPGNSIKENQNDDGNVATDRTQAEDTAKTQSGRSSSSSSSTKKTDQDMGIQSVDYPTEVKK